MPKYQLQSVYGKITRPAPQEWRLLISDADDWDFDSELHARLTGWKQRGDNLVQTLTVTAGPQIIRTVVIKSRPSRTTGKPETVVMGMTGVKWRDAADASADVLWDTAARLTPDQQELARAARALTQGVPA